MRKTMSIWAHLDAPTVRSSFTNPVYQPTNEVLYPVSSLRRLRFWDEYYLRFDDIAFLSGAEGAEDLDDTNGGGGGADDSLLSQANTVVWVPDERAQVCWTPLRIFV